MLGLRHSTWMLADASSLRSHRSTVEMFYWNGCKVNVCEAANIDRCHRIALRINGLGIRMNATCLAEMVLDDVLVEGVRANTFLRCEQVQLIARHEPQKGAFARTDRTVAFHRSGEFTFNLECDLSAVADSFVDHVPSSCGGVPAESGMSAATINCAYSIPSIIRNSRSTALPSTRSAS